MTTALIEKEEQEAIIAARMLEPDVEAPDFTLNDQAYYSKATKEAGDDQFLKEANQVGVQLIKKVEQEKEPVEPVEGESVEVIPDEPNFKLEYPEVVKPEPRKPIKMDTKQLLE